MKVRGGVAAVPGQVHGRFPAGPEFHPAHAGPGPVEPVYYESRLNEAARSDAGDMADNRCFQHDSCDETAWADRIWSFYREARWMSENIATGCPSAKAVVDAWLCDETGRHCAADGTWAAGRRTNIGTISHRKIGTGYAAGDGSLWRRYWVEDFAANEPASAPPFVAGCHDLLAPGQASLLLNCRDTGNQPPASLQVVVDGTAYNMNLDLGAPAAGTYRLDVDRVSARREHYVLAVTASGRTWRYPAPGVFLTDGEAACGDYR